MTDDYDFIFVGNPVQYFDLVAGPDSGFHGAQYNSSVGDDIYGRFFVFIDNGISRNEQCILMLFVSNREAREHTRYEISGRE